MKKYFDDNTLKEITNEITNNYNSDCLFCLSKGSMPNRTGIIHIIMKLRQIMFPGYFEEEHLHNDTARSYFVGSSLMDLHDLLYTQVRAALSKEESDLLEKENSSESAEKVKSDTSNIDERTEEICSNFIASFGKIQNLILKDIQAAFDGDPAAKTKEEIIYCYPGLLAIFIYRFAHELYKMKVPFIPRIMTEYAHGHTGIDINPGATIGEYFFIDHGTGVVIGETTKIGDYVKIYQGVTLGALSTRSGQLLRDVKRHPTIEDHVTIYSNASILGGETIIGEGSVIGGNAFITESVPKFSRLTADNSINIEPINKHTNTFYE